MELTQLFGITVEQLLSGEIPEPRLESDSGVSLKNIGQFIDGMINDIGNVFKSEPKDAPEAVDGAVDAQVVGENAGEEPAAEPSPEGGEDAAEADGIDLAKLLQMAPFMSKGAVEDMLRSWQAQADRGGNREICAVRGQRIFGIAHRRQRSGDQLGYAAPDRALFEEGGGRCIRPRDCDGGEVRSPGRRQRQKCRIECV